MLKVGDVVVLKSGGPMMTVSDPARKMSTSEAKVECAYFHEGSKKTEVFPADALKLSEGHGN